MYASDKSGLSDPYIFVAFHRYSARTRVVNESVCPTWDQTILLNQIRMYGSPASIVETPPPVTLEFFDKDVIVSSEYWAIGCILLLFPEGGGGWGKMVGHPMHLWELAM